MALTKAKTKTQAINRTLNKLRGALGTGEKPPGSNFNFIVKWYNTEVDKIGNGPWCEMTATWCMWTTGARALKKGRAYTIYAAQDAIKGVNGCSWHWGTKGMRAGDHVYYDFSGKKGDVAVIDHVGIVEKVHKDKKTFDVLEGNVGAGVLKRMQRDKKFVVGYIRFDWDRILLQEADPNEAEPDAVVDLDAKPEPLEVDGELGPKTIKRWQQILDVPVTGKMGPTFVKTVQTRLKETVDHRLEVTGKGLSQDGSRSRTIGALQRYLKSPVDEVIDVENSNVIKALQRRLNTGRF